jgi:hypothetical protein
VVRLSTFISCVLYPINEKTSTPLASARESVYLPEASVAVPTVVPFSTMLTPARGSFVSSLTIPVMVCSTEFSITSDAVISDDSFRVISMFLLI